MYKDNVSFTCDFKVAKSGRTIPPAKPELKLSAFTPFAPVFSHDPS